MAWWKTRGRAIWTEAKSRRKKRQWFRSRSRALLRPNQLRFQSHSPVAVYPNPLRATEVEACLFESDREQDGTRNQEWPHGSPDAPIVIEAETRTKNVSTAQGDLAFPSEDADTTCAMSVVHSVKPDQRKGETGARNNGQRQSPFTGPHRRSETEPMETMVAVVVPAISRCQQDPVIPKGNESERHVPLTRQRKARQKSMRQVLTSQHRRTPGSPARPASDNGAESDVRRTSDLSDDSDEDYTASSDDGDSVKTPAKRRKLSSRSAVTTSRRAPSRSRPRVARAVGDHRQTERKPRSVPSVAAAERSVGSTRAGQKRCKRSSPVVPAGGAEQTLSPRLLSPEDISTLVSAFAQKLLDLRRDSSTDAMRGTDEEVAVVHADESASEDERIGERGRKRPRWTREDDRRLKDLKTRGWRWWEIEQQFPGRTKSALQQRWSTFPAREASPVTDVQKQECKPIN
ncbi:predicted protein [Histoplasma mississippiense (nom. inval.)]|uniref:predicted protein n=1 Tax=Ajellomyces capsulatus (strain NAm1 / WU24) TaxID=2059318 RepID=UPI000157CAF9|nr:predicted protein [Histoplasma mississippiense (nom. inval.)]EDN09783.1 predicted protein [Histoplasma mississippiense (nom. inval.)]